MKKVFVIVFAQLVTLALSAQSGTTRIDQYCQVIATPRLLSNKVTIDIDFGKETSSWGGTRLRSYDGRLKKFNTIIDALNFMGKEGFFFFAYPVRRGEIDIYHFGFKKTISPVRGSVSQ